MRGKPGGVVADYYAHFADGINPFYSQTRDGLLILEGDYNKLHTPLGYWQICSGVSGPSEGFPMATRAVLNDPAWKVELICPGYQTNMGYHGPWFLMTEFKGQCLLPEGFVLPPFQGDPDRDYDRSQDDFGEVVRPRLELLGSLYKKREDWHSYDEGLILRREAIKNAYVMGLWSDPTDVLDRAKAAGSVAESELILREYEKNNKWGIAFTDYHWSKAKKVAEALHAKEETYHEDLLSLLCYSYTYVPKHEEL
jgi:hypothetical protein